MYVDKPLSGIKAVQTLSRLNRAHPKKYDTFVLDFYNDSEMIRSSFEPYYRTTILSEETDPNKLHDLKARLDGYQVYGQAPVEQLVELYLAGADRDRLDPILDGCVGTYMESLDEDGQVDFKGKAKAFVRTYGFLASILPFQHAEWEKLSIFLNFLKDGESGPLPTSGGGRMPEPELDYLSNIVKSFNEHFGNIGWKDGDQIRKVIADEIPGKVAADRAYQNAMKNSDKQNARIEHDKALQRVIVDLLTDHTELFKQFQDNALFKKWLGDTIFSATYREAGAR